MTHLCAFLSFLGCIAGTVITVSCTGDSTSTASAPGVSFKPSSAKVVPRSMRELGKEVGLHVSYMPTTTYARQHASSMRPRFITIHSTDNTAGTANSHARYLNSGQSRSLNWHFTVDESNAYQHIPTTETGHHADHGHTGDRSSIAIEMCDCTRQNDAAVYNRTAKLTALLMKRYSIPINNVVPHNYWSGKNCPRPLMDNGRPGFKWSWFLSRVDYYSRCLR